MTANTFSPDASGEIANLIDRLHTTDQRLEELLAGEVDSVSDREGRTILLRRAQAHVRSSEVTRQAAILNALPAHIALLDASGVILTVNTAWRKFADANGLEPASHAVGLNYLGVCHPDAPEVAEGIRSVLRGSAQTFHQEYPCHAPTQERWFMLSVAPLVEGAHHGAVVMHVDVTERIKAARALAALSVKTEARERMLTTMLSSISDYAYILDREGRFLFANHALLQAWGVAWRQSHDRRFPDPGFGREACEHMSRQLREVFDAKSRMTGELPHVNPEGLHRWFEYILSPAFAVDGSVDFVVGSTREITERKRAEQALRSSEAAFRTLAEAMPQIVWMRQADGQDSYFSQKWMDYTGLTHEESQGEKWQLPIHPDDLQPTVDAWGKATAAKAIYSAESRLRRADGVYRWWLCRAAPMLDAGGEILKWVGTCTDIHEMKLAELQIQRTNRELAQQQAELSALLDIVPVMICVKDTQNHIIRVNRQFAQFLGRTAADIKKLPAQELFADAMRYYGEDLKLLRMGTSQTEVPELMQDQTGNKRWIQRTKVPYREAGGGIIGILVMLQDITERKREQDELQALAANLEVLVAERTTQLTVARNEAEQANRAKSAFLATMSHEIRTPMNGVIGMIEMLQQTSLMGYQVEMADLIRDSAFALLQIIDDILDFSRIESGMLQVQSEPMDLALLVEKVCNMLGHLAARQGVRMSVFVDPALPVVVLGDEGRLRQVLINLAGNAIKFSGGRDMPGRVRVRLVLVEQVDDAVTVDLTVEDDGIGIEEQALARLFVPFTQADSSTTRRFGGSGLGLAISDMLVRLMGGTIYVRSEPGTGSTFTGRFLFGVPGVTAAATPGVGDLEGLRCRIIGGEAQMAEDLERSLVHEGLDVQRSIDLQAAMAAESAQGAASSLWLVLPGPQAPSAEELRGIPTPVVVLGWGDRRAPRIESPGVVSVDANSLSRQTLQRALGLALGHCDEEQPVTGASRRTSFAEGEVLPGTRDEAMRAGRLILVAEDNETNRIVILRQLALLGFQADVAKDGVEALERWRTGGYALLLSDLHMPRMDGYELAAAIRAEEEPGCRLPIIAVTANALRDEELRCLAAGMDAYLSKPARLGQLKATIEAQLERVSATLPDCVDLAVLSEMVGDDPKTIDDVLESFGRSALKAQLEIGDALAGRTWETAGAAAHQLHGAAASIGAARLAQICEQFEAAAKALQVDTLESLRLQLMAAIAEVTQFVQARKPTGTGARSSSK